MDRQYGQHIEKYPRVGYFTAVDPDAAILSDP